MSSEDRAYPIVIGDGGSTADTEGRPALLVGEEPDTLVDWGRVGDLHVRAASVRGRLHRYEGTARQDSFCLGVAEGAALVVAVADGVSAAPRSDLASRTAVRSAVDFVVSALAVGGHDDGGAGAIDWAGCIDDARVQVLEVARDRAGDPSLDPSVAAGSMATTLTVGVVDLVASDDGTRGVRVVAFGDVGGWILGAEGTWRALTPIKNADSVVAESAVAALPLDYGGEVVEHRGRLAPGEAFLLLSDGIGDPVGDGTGLVGRELGRAWGGVPTPFELAAWVDFARRTHTDDRTAVGVWPTR